MDVKVENGGTKAIVNISELPANLQHSESSGNSDFTTILYLFGENNVAMHLNTEFFEATVLRVENKTAFFKSISFNVSEEFYQRKGVQFTSRNHHFWNLQILNEVVHIGNTSFGISGTVTDGYSSTELVRWNILEILVDKETRQTARIQQQLKEHSLGYMTAAPTKKKMNVSKEIFQVQESAKPVCVLETAVNEADLDSNNHAHYMFHLRLSMLILVKYQKEHLNVRPLLHQQLSTDVTSVRLKSYQVLFEEECLLGDRLRVCLYTVNSEHDVVIHICKGNRQITLFRADMFPCDFQTTNSKL